MPAGGNEGGQEAAYGAEVARLRGDAREQRGLLEARREGPVARCPKQTIAMCAGEVFVGKTPHEAAVKAREAHPDRASFFYTHGAGIPWLGG